MPGIRLILAMAYAWRIRCMLRLKGPWSTNFSFSRCPYADQFWCIHEAKP